jgi:hypothetical protein
MFDLTKNNAQNVLAMQESGIKARATATACRTSVRAQ